MSRDDFTAITVKALANRAGHRCSFPGCSRATLGPSEESGIASGNVGTACHIVSAACGPNARRRNPALATADRADISNGIWMCATHGRLIDTDEVTFTVEMLQGWRDLAERKAAFRVKHGVDVSIDSVLAESKLIDGFVAVSSTEGIFNAIGQAFDNHLITELWGDQIAMDARDAIVEIAINSIRHGGASYVRLDISGATVTLTDDGQSFSAWKNLGVGGGGAAHVNHLKNARSHNLLLEHEAIPGGNRHLVCLLRHARDVTSVSKCVFSVFDESLPPRPEKLSCDCIYLMCPAMIVSGITWYLEAAIECVPSGKEVVIVAPKTSDFVLKHIRDAFPQARVVVPLFGE